MDVAADIFVLKSVFLFIYLHDCQGTYVKDLSLIGRELASTLIVDNSKNSYMFQPQCGEYLDLVFTLTVAD